VQKIQWSNPTLLQLHGIPLTLLTFVRNQEVDEKCFYVLSGSMVHNSRSDHSHEWWVMIRAAIKMRIHGHREYCTWPCALIFSHRCDFTSPAWLQLNYVQYIRWRGIATGRALDLRSVGRRFKSYSGQRCVTTLGKLFTPYVTQSPSSINWYRAKGGDALQLGR